MLFEIAASAKSDHANLTKKGQGLFKEAAAILNVAADRFVATGDPSVWPKKLRVKSMTHARHFRDDPVVLRSGRPVHLGMDQPHG